KFDYTYGGVTSTFETKQRAGQDGEIQLVEYVDANENVVSEGFGGVGVNVNQIAFKDHNGRIALYDYNAYNGLTRGVDALGRETRYVYGLIEFPTLLTSMTDAQNRLMRYEYDD